MFGMLGILPNLADLAEVWVWRDVYIHRCINPGKLFFFICFDTITTRNIGVGRRILCITYTSEAFPHSRRTWAQLN